MKKFTLSIAEPCHENWDKMTPNEQGNFCGSCQKTVIDFSKKTDKEIIKYFKDYSGNTCGRFKTNQLDKEFTVPFVPIFDFAKPFAAVALPLSLSFATITANAQIKGEVEITKTENIKPVCNTNIRMGKLIPPKNIKPEKNIIGDTIKKPIIPKIEPLVTGVPKISTLKIMGGISSIATSHQPLYILNGQPFKGNINTLNPNEIEKIDVLKSNEAIALFGAQAEQGVIVITTKKKSTSIIPFRGKITDQNYNPLPFVSIIEVSNNKNGTASNNLGMFNLNIKETETENIKLSISAIGYESKIIVVNKNDLELNIVLNENSLKYIEVGMIVVTKTTSLNKINGLVLNDNGEAIKNATIKIIDVNDDYKSDSLGKFILKGKRLQHKKIIVSAQGYETKTITIKEKQETIILKKINKLDILQSIEMFVYPNPIQKNNYLNITFKNTNALTGKLNIFDSQQKLLETKKINSSKSNFSLLISHEYISGIYFLQYVDETTYQTKTQKFIVF